MSVNSSKTVKLNFLNPFFINFYFVAFENIGNFNLLNAPTTFSFPANKILLKKIEAVLQPQTVMTDTK